MGRLNQPIRLLVADPPWLFEDDLPGSKRGASKHYPCMPTDDICDFLSPLRSGVVLPPISRTCLLVMWRVASMLEDALRVCRSWGFVPASELVWCKTTKDGTRPRIGMGHSVRNAHESAIIGTRPGYSSLIQSRAVPSWFTAPAGAHSEKPDEFFAVLDRLVPTGPRMELFARQARPGWHCVGNELPGGYVPPEEEA